METGDLLELLDRLEKLVSNGNTVLAKRLIEQEINNLKRSNRKRM